MPVQEVVTLAQDLRLKLSVNKTSEILHSDVVVADDKILGSSYEENGCK